MIHHKLILLSLQLYNQIILFSQVFIQTPTAQLHVVVTYYYIKCFASQTCLHLSTIMMIIVDVYSQKCTLWKNGVHWLMKSGVEAVVEVVKQSRAVLVMVTYGQSQALFN